MAILIQEPNLCSFIHIPKTAGTSIEKWMSSNFSCKYTKGDKHCTVDVAKSKLGNLGETFCVVRNPWDWCVSWYQFSFERAKRRLDFIENHNIQQYPNIKEKYNKQHQIDTIKKYERGFEYWLTDFTKKPQLYWAQDVKCILKLETLKTDFKKIQNYTNCYSPLPFLNKSNRQSYKEYYTTTTKKIVESRYIEDIETFNYKFD
jgi:hypothetical protein